MPSLRIRGATLAGIACAARLAKLGHLVELDTGGDDLGAHWSPAQDRLAPVLTLPATWRDLFKKSGRTLDAELARSSLELIEAPPAIHRFADGAELPLPTERGRQFAILTARYGQPVAERWRDTLDALDEVWLAARRFGVESPASPSAGADLRALWLDRTLADIAERVGHPHLAEIVLSLAPLAGTRSRHAPGLLASRLVVERTFGRWRLVDADGAALPATRLLGLLEERLATRRVRVVEGLGAEEHSVDCLPRAPLLTRAALAPATSHSWEDRAGEEPFSEVIDHTGRWPVVTWRVPTAEGVSVLTRDYNHAHRAVSWGLEPRSARSVLRRVPIDRPGAPPRASACSPAGPEPWAELASAALAVYEVHERLTGEDCRPTNRSRR